MLPNFLVLVRMAILATDQRFSTFLERGMVVGKSRLITRSALQALAIKENCHPIGSWDAPLPTALHYDPALKVALFAQKLLTAEQAVKVTRDTATKLDIDPTEISFALKLTADDKERFQIAPEQIDELDGAFFRAIASRIEETTAQDLEASCRRSGITPLRYLRHTITNSSDELGTAAEEQLHAMLQQGLVDITVAGFNNWHLTYTTWNNAQPSQKVKSTANLHKDYIDIMRKLGDNVFMQYELKRIQYERTHGRHPATSFPDEVLCIREMLDSMSTKEATNALTQHGHGLLTRSTFDPNKGGRGGRPMCHFWEAVAAYYWVR